MLTLNCLKIEIETMKFLKIWWKMHQFCATTIFKLKPTGYKQGIFSINCFYNNNMIYSLVFVDFYVYCITKCVDDIRFLYIEFCKYDVFVSKIMKYGSSIRIQFRSILYNLRKRKHHFYQQNMIYFKETNQYWWYDMIR